MKRLIVKLANNGAIRYCFFGLLTTLVNVCCYALLTRMTPLGSSLSGETLSNVIAIVLSIVFAFVTNSRFVFHSTASTVGQHMGEFARFFGARLSTLLIEVGGVALMSVLGMNDMIAKLLTQVIVFVLNYIFSRFLVFTKHGKKASK